MTRRRPALAPGLPWVSSARALGLSALVVGCTALTASEVGSGTAPAATDGAGPATALGTHDAAGWLPGSDAPTPADVGPVHDPDATPVGDAPTGSDSEAPAGDTGTSGACDPAACPAATEPCHRAACTAEGGCGVEIDPDAACDDEDPCTLGDACSAEGLCGGTPLDCDDGVACTSDACNPASEDCVNIPSGDCSCFKLEDPICVDGDPCTLDLCDLETFTCALGPLLGASCDDGDPCTDLDICLAGGLCAGSPKSCSAGNPCLEGSCDPAAGGCVETPGEGACDDGAPCTASAGCVDGGCEGGSCACDDGQACTFEDACTASGCTGVALSTWTKAMAGADADLLHAALRGPDGDVVLVGETASYTAEGVDGWLLRFDAGGGLLASFLFGGSGHDALHDLEPLSGAEGPAWVTAGTAESPDSGQPRAWIMAVDAQAEIAWEVHHDPGWAELRGLAPRDAGWAAVGRRKASGAGQADPWQPWFVLLGPEGQLITEKLYTDAVASMAGGFDHIVRAAPPGEIPPPDAGWIVAGTIEDAAGGRWMQVLHVDHSGGVLWSKAFGPSLEEELAAMVATSTGSAVLGTTGLGTAGARDWRLLRLDGAGSTLSEVTWGSTADERAAALVAVGSDLVGFGTRATAEGTDEGLVVRWAASGAVTGVTAIGPDEAAAELALRVAVPADAAGGAWHLAGGSRATAGAPEDGWVATLDEGFGESCP